MSSQPMLETDFSPLPGIPYECWVDIDSWLTEGDEREVWTNFFSQSFNSARGLLFSCLLNVCPPQLPVYVFATFLQVETDHSYPLLPICPCFQQKLSLYEASTFCFKISFLENSQNFSICLLCFSLLRYDPVSVEISKYYFLIIRPKVITKIG